MARGFESKAVADQQEQVSSPTVRKEPVGAHRRRLELSRADVQKRLETATADGHRQMLQRALTALDEEIATLS